MVSNYASIQMGRIQREMPRPVRPTAASSTDASGGAKNSKYCWLQPDAYTFFFSFDILGSLKCHPPRKRWRTYRRNRPPLQSTENACLSRFYYGISFFFFLSFLGRFNDPLPKLPVVGLRRTSVSPSDASLAIHRFA